jgi:hypothetical protein
MLGVVAPAADTGAEGGQDRHHAALAGIVSCGRGGAVVCGQQGENASDRLGGLRRRAY